MYSNFSSLVQKTLKIDADYFIKGGFWLILGQIFTIIFGLISTVLFTHFLSESEYGIYKYLLSLAAIFSLFSLTGLGQSILQTAAKGFHGFYKEVLSINLKYNLGISAAALAGSLYYFINDNTTLALGCLTIAIIQPIINTYKYIPVYLIGTKQFAQSTKLNLFKMLFVTSTGIATLFLTNNILLLFAVYLSGNLVVNIFSQFFYKPETLKVPNEIYSHYISYAKNTSIRNIIGDIAYRIDNIVVFTQLGAAELAIYVVASVIPEQIKSSFKSLAKLFLPKLAQQTNIEIAKKNILKRSIQLFIIFLIVSITYILLSPFIYTTLFPKYESAILLSQLLAISFPAAIALLPINLLQVHTKEKKLYMFNLISSAMTATLTVSLISIYGLMGAIIAKVVSRYISMGVSFYYLYKKQTLS